MQRQADINSACRVVFVMGETFAAVVRSLLTVARWPFNVSSNPRPHPAFGHLLPSDGRRLSELVVFSAKLASTRGARHETRAWNFYFCEKRKASKSRSSAGVWIIPSGMGERSWISRFAMSLFFTAR